MKNAMITLLVCLFAAPAAAQELPKLTLDSTFSYHTPPKNSNDFRMVSLSVPQGRMPEPTPACHYWSIDGTLYILVDENLPVEERTALTVHELVEAIHQMRHGIQMKAIYDFDLAWEPHDNVREPGIDPESPYCDEHVLGLGAERWIIESFGISWEEYNKRMEEAQWGTPKK